MDFTRLDGLLTDITDGLTIPAIEITVGLQGNIVFSRAYGKILETGEKISRTTRFDIASLTKILSGLCFMRLVEQGVISLNDPICDLFPGFNRRKPIEKNGETIGWCDASKVTWYHVLTHTSGMGWTRPKTRPSLPHLNQGLDDIYSLPFAYQPGEHIVYSDIPIILVGFAIERLTQKKLDAVVESVICNPLSMNRTGYIRISSSSIASDPIAPTEYDSEYRKRRIWRQVHDENAYLLDGVSAHAGIFSTSDDLCKLAIKLNSCLKADGIIKRDTAAEMTKEQVSEDGDRRGLIWQLKSDGSQSYTRTLSGSAYGHAGFTGCFLWNDPVKDLSVVLLSNDVYNGRDKRRLSEFRPEIMSLITKGIEKQR